MSDLSNHTVSELLVLYRGVLRELRRREVIRSDNAPAGDFAEYLTAAVFDGELAPASEKSWDVRADDGTRLQVKTRVVSDRTQPGQRQLGVIRSFEFDALVVVLFDGDYRVWKVVSVPLEMVQGIARYRSHVNGFVLHATDRLLTHEHAVDLTDRFTAVLAALETRDPG